MAIEDKERRLLLQAGLQGAVIALQSRVIAGADPLLVLNDLLRTLVELSGSAAGFIAEQQQVDRASANWRSVVTDHIATIDLADPTGSILAALTAAEISIGDGAGHESAAVILRQVRPDLSSFLL